MMLMTLPPRRNALWWALVNGCAQAEEQASLRHSDPKDAQLDWFGVPVKAQELSSLLHRMRLLAERASLSFSPVRPPCLLHC